VKYLLDINTLIALGHTAHVHHARALAWFQSVKKTSTGLCTCAITELGFVRVTVQTALQTDIPSARRALALLKASSTIPVEMLPDAIGVDKLPAFAKTPNKLTDGHLLELARHHGAQLVSLDTGISGAILLP
jgi:toxin-antitoxin system PIN domain toxin